MDKKVFDALAGWAAISTWHTHHPSDEKRFHAAMTKLFRDVGSSVSEDDLRNALKAHRDRNIEDMGGKPTDEMLERHVRDATTILSYLRNEGL